MNVTCISASNVKYGGTVSSTSYCICEPVFSSILNRGTTCESSIIDLRKYPVLPCIGGGKCHGTHRCACDDAFNRMYETAMPQLLEFWMMYHIPY
jgi:multimeric flavodoxin WrbA